MQMCELGTTCTVKHSAGLCDNKIAKKNVQLPQRKMKNSN